MIQILFRSNSPSIEQVGSEPDWARIEAGVGSVAAAAARTRREAMLASWAETVGIPRHALVEDQDWEDWSENAEKLLRAVDSGLPVYVMGHDGARDLSEGRSTGAFTQTFNATGPFSYDAPNLYLGGVRRFGDPLFQSYGYEASPLRFAHPLDGRLGRGTRYWRSPQLREALGRGNAIARGNPDGDDGYVKGTRDLMEAGAAALMVKIIFAAKYDTVHKLDLPASEVPTAEAVERAFFDAFEVNLMDCDGRRECFLIQERLDLRHEYRIVVVDGCPVAGAGTVEWLSPVVHDPSDGPFDPLVEDRRNDGSLARREGLVEDYRRFADDLCGRLRASGDGEFTDCTMDLGVDAASGKIVLIETNPPDNFGLYAMDFGAVLRAQIAAAERRFGIAVRLGPACP